MPKYLVIGSRGWIGGQLCSFLHEAGQDVVESPTRLTTRDQVDTLIRRTTPDRIVCAVGRTHTSACSTIDALEALDMRDDVNLANYELPLWIAESAGTFSPPIPMLYLGTGCIFAYDHAHPIGSAGFSEDDLPNFFGSVYSRTKGATDSAMKSHPHVINARIRMPIADVDSPRDFISKLLSYSRVISVPNSMTVLPSVLPVLLALLHTGAVVGTLNAVNPGPLDHENVLRIFAEETGRLHSYTLISVDELTRSCAAERSNNTLTSDRLQALLRAVPPDVRDLFRCPEEVPTLEDALKSAARRRRAAQ